MNTTMMPSASIGRVDLNSLMSAKQSQSPSVGQQGGGGESKSQELFNRWVGMTFYGQLLAEMRKSVGKSAYFHGGRAEEVFQGQLDQQIAESMADASAQSFSGPMFELAMLSRPK
jgi:hypothetical protein